MRRQYNEKSKIIIISIILIFGVYFSALAIWNSKAQARYITDSEGIVIEYNNRIYKELNRNDFPLGYELADDFSNDEKPIRVIYDNGRDYFFPFPLSYISVFNTSYDDPESFIFYDPNDTSINFVCADESFVFPTVQDSTISEVWLSSSVRDNDNIKDKDKIAEIVKSAKNGKASPLNNELGDYLLSNSIDNHSILLKFENCPIIVRYYIENADGNYVLMPESE